MKNSMLKIIVVISLSIIALWLLFTILFPMGFGMTMNYSIPTHMGNGFNYSYGFNNYGGFATLLLVSLIKVFTIALFVTLLFGIFMYVKNNVFSKEDIDSIKKAFTGKQLKTDKFCSECGKTINDEWKVCPHCGKEVDK